MKDGSALAALMLAAMAGDVDKRMKAPADISEQLARAVAEHNNRKPFAVGDLVFAKEHTKWKRHHGLPSVVLAVRPDAPPDFTAKGLDCGNALDLRIGFWTPIAGVVPQWASSFDFEPYDEVQHGSRPEPKSAAAPEAEAATA